MIRLHRPQLSARSSKFLAKRSAKVAAAVEPAAEVRRLWKLRNNATFAEILGHLRTMAAGLTRCCYCEDSAGTDIEHFYPKVAYPDRAFSWPNYLLACSTCNSNFKRT